jgi:hypothetical protein
MIHFNYNKSKEGEKAKPVVRQGRKATDLGIGD